MFISGEKKRLDFGLLKSIGRTKNETLEAFQYQALSLSLRFYKLKNLSFSMIGGAILSNLKR